ncbi:MAG TPA: chorismate lyase [Pusillimonas sp.]
MELHPSKNSGWLAAPSPSLTRQQKYWLFRPGALTAGLRHLGHVQLRVVAEHTDGLCASEAWMLQREARSPVWVREIIMSIDGVDSVFARSFTPLSASHGLWQGMRRLRTRPLADMLYNNPQIIRSPFFARRLSPQQPMYRSVRNALLGADPGKYPCGARNDEPAPAPAPGSKGPAAQRLLARCSVFWRHGQPLLVAECFLPEFWPLAAKSAYEQGLSLKQI